MMASATQGPPSVVSRNRLGVSDLGRRLADQVGDASRTDDHGVDPGALELSDVRADRKSTRLNSSHMSISYAVFCLKKKKKHIFFYFLKKKKKKKKKKKNTKYNK